MEADDDGEIVEYKSFFFVQLDYGHEIQKKYL